MDTQVAAGSALDALERHGDEGLKKQIAEEKAKEVTFEDTSE